MLFCWKEETPIVRALTTAPLLRISQRRCSDWNYILRLPSAGFESITIKKPAVTSRGGRKL